MKVTTLLILPYKQINSKHCLFIVLKTVIIMIAIELLTNTFANRHIRYKLSDKAINGSNYTLSKLLKNIFRLKMLSSLFELCNLFFYFMQII